MSGAISYDERVTEAEFWQAVGKQLAEHRKRHKGTHRAIKANGGPSNKTVQAIEDGDVGQLAALRVYAKVLRVDLLDIFRSVLSVDENTSPELQHVVRSFKTAETLGDFGVRIRSAMLELARLVDDPQHSPQTASPGDLAPTRTGTIRAEHTTAKRRGKK